MSVNKERKPRILLVSHTAGKYGAERSLLTLADRLQKQGLAEVIVLLPETGPLLNDLRSMGIESRVVRYYQWIGYSWARMAFLKRLARIPLTVIGALRVWPWARQWDPDLIYINTVACPMGLILASLLGKPHIWHVREWIGDELNSKYDLGRSIVMSLLNRGKAEIIFNSRAIADIYAEHLPAAKPVIVYNGFDFSDLSPPDAHRRYKDTVANAPVVRLAVIGSVQPVKGQEDAIRALPALLTEGLPVRLEIMGSGTSEYIAYLENLAAELRVADYVSFKGYVMDIAGQLDGIAAVLVPSRYEPFGRVAVESQAHGVPVVAAAAGGLPEIVLDGKTGLLFPPRNFNQLAAKVAILLQDRALYESFVAGAWLHVTQQFTQDRYVAGVWAVMLNAINEVDTGKGIVQG